MNQDGQRLQAAITAARQEGWLRRGVWVLLRCAQAGCVSWETNVWVEELDGCRAWQAPARCVRCGTPCEFHHLETDDGRTV